MPNEWIESRPLFGVYMGYAAWETPGSGLDAHGIVKGMSQTLGPFKIVTSILMFMLTTGLGPFAETNTDQDVFYYNDFGMALFESFFFWVLNELWYLQASHHIRTSYAYARPWSHSRRTIASCKDESKRTHAHAQVFIEALHWLSMPTWSTDVIFCAGLLCACM